jgi:hypothetical protein
MAETSQVVFELYDMTQQEVEAVAEVLSIAEVLFPGLRDLAGGFEESIPALRDNWYVASTEAHLQTIVFARYLHDALLPAVVAFYRDHKEQLSAELARVYGNDLARFSHAVEAYFAIAVKMGAEEMHRAVAVSAFVLSQPGLRENVGRMRLEYEQGKRVKFSDSGLGRKRA